MRFQVYISAFATTLFMANASDSLGHSNSEASAPIELFSLADAQAMDKTAEKPKEAAPTGKTKGAPAAAAKAEKEETKAVNDV